MRFWDGVGAFFRWLLDVASFHTHKGVGVIVLLALFLLLAMALSRVLYFVIKRTPLIDRLKEKDPEKAYLVRTKVQHRLLIISEVIVFIAFVVLLVGYVIYKVRWLKGQH